MKKFFLISFILFYLFTNTVYAGDPLRKLGRGISNSCLGWLEFPKGIQDVGLKDGPVAAITYGVLKGIAKTILRTAVGIYETTTFLLPLPENYEPILKDPEFFLKEED